MTIGKATESGWRPVTKQDLIDLIDGDEPQAARFRDTESEPWRHDFLVGFDVVASRLRYTKRNSNCTWKFCEIKTQVLRDPKFSDLENGPIECMIYPDGGHEIPQKGVLVGMIRRPNTRNATGIEYHARYARDESDLPSRSRWHVKVVDTEVEAVKTKTDELPKQVEPTDDGWRTPTVEDLRNGPIECEFRDGLTHEWSKGTLTGIFTGNCYPYRTFGKGFRYCRIRSNSCQS